MNQCVLLMGGNLGNVPLTFSLARTLIAEGIGPIEAESSLYTSAPWGFTSDDLFYNQVLVVNTSLPAELVLNKILEIETYFGRTRVAGQGYQSRTLDLDILFFNQDIIEKENLQIPHPRLHLRNFTLIPLVELIPDFKHPVFHFTMRQLLIQSPDEHQVQRL